MFLVTVVTFPIQPSLQSMFLSRKVKQELKDLDYFSVTTDMWSSANMMPYMSLTIQYLMTDWGLQSKCLETVFLPESHTADTHAPALRSLDEKKLACVTTDN